MQPNAPVPFGPPPGVPNNPYPQLPKSGGFHFPWLGMTLVITVFMLFGALGFAGWAFTSRQDYKNNVDKKIAAAVKVQAQKTSSAKDVEFAEKEKSPYHTYTGPATYGGVSVTYPKTWSAYVNEGDKNVTNFPVDGYFHPNYVPGILSGTNFALRIQVVGQPYAKEMQTYDAFVKTGSIKATAYSAPKVQGVLGTMLEGEINRGQNGIMVVFPIRDKTLKISTQSQEFANDFKNTILANLTFEP